MRKISTYTVYNASAGSGKTYTLVRDFLTILLSKTDSFYFKHLLAITFTNKAATEMKERVLGQLKCFSTDEMSDMKRDIAKRLHLDYATLQTRATQVLKAILQDYQSLHITTIDSFTHRIIRSFAYDFGLSNDFDIELDSEKILMEAVERVMSQIGSNENITQSVLTFALENIDDNKNWDISRQVFEFSKLLLQEADKKHIDQLAHRKPSDYYNWQRELKMQIRTLESAMQKIGVDALQIINNAGLEHQDFLRSALPNHFLKLAENWEKADFFDQNTKLRESIENSNFFKKNAKTEVILRIENILPQLIELYLESEKLYSDITLKKLWLSALHPMGLLRYVHNALTDLKKEKNLLFISDFNDLIFNKIKDEPAPFIYERLGERYHHYFIDEMQDTSVLQWQNLINLIDNALAQEGGSLLLVGDVKQSIYRWRGSVPEQFMELAKAEHQIPFHTPKTVEQLETNYRSYDTVIDFNNRFFAHISHYLQHKDYAHLYRNESYQHATNKIGGYVNLQFLPKADKDEDKDLRFPQRVWETLQQIPSDYAKKDICILTRTLAQGRQLAEFLTQQGVPVLTSESLLLRYQEKVLFLTSFFSQMYEPENLQYRFQVLYYLHRLLAITTAQDAFIKQFISYNPKTFLEKLSDIGIHFNPEVYFSKSLYDASEYVYRCFLKSSEPDVYIQFFLEWVLDYQLKNGSDWGGLLTYWNENNHKLSISTPEQEDAIRIMSIHKAKGLEFPVVLFPYDLDIYKTYDAKIWYTADETEDTFGFTDILIPYSAKLPYTNYKGAELFHNFQTKLELDNFNLLYVALTRAKEQLYVITDYPMYATGDFKIKHFSGLFADYLTAIGLFSPEKMTYSFGQNNRPVSELHPTTTCTSPQPTSENLTTWLSTDTAQERLLFVQEADLYWNNPQGTAIQLGTLMHKMLAEIVTVADISTTVQLYVNKGYLAVEEAIQSQQILHELLQKPEIQPFFDHNNKTYCEREIIVPGGGIFIPDRIVFFNEQTIGILEYKTGKPQDIHRTQLTHYIHLLEQMTYVVSHAYLVYVAEPIEIIAVK